LTGLDQPDEIEIRFRKESALDEGDPDVVIELHVKLFEHCVTASTPDPRPPFALPSARSACVADPLRAHDARTKS
jgi:hypothetical protein